MRVIWYECKKILNVRLILILTVFTMLFYNMFLELPAMYTGKDGVSLTIDLYLDLMEKLGPTISMDEYNNELQEKKQELSAERDKLVKANPVFAKQRIKNYKQLEEYEESMDNMPQDQWTKDQKQCMKEIINFEFFNEKSAKLIFQKQEIERMDEFHYEAKDYGLSEKEAKALVQEEQFDGTSDKYKKRAEALSRRQEISLLPDWVSDCIGRDMPRLAILILICCMVLIVPYQIRERISNVIPIYAATRTGRKIFDFQAIAVLVTSSFVCLMQFGTYSIMCFIKGVFVFRNCPASSLATPLWIEISFGAYFLLYLLLIWVITIALYLAAYMISRISANYIIGIAISIPMGVCSCMYIDTALWQIYYFPENTIRLWIHWTVFLCLIGFTIGTLVLLKKDKRRGI